MHTKLNQLRHNQAGFASLVIALMLVLVLSLTTVGFAELMRHEEKSALDKHLSSQAYYAAETGINDAAKAINSGFALSKPYCGTWTGPASNGTNYLMNNNVGNDSSISYPCLLIDPAPPSLEYDPVDDSDNAKVFLMTGTNTTDPTQNELIKQIKISWQASDSGVTNFAPAGTTSFDKASVWNYPPVLRIALTPLASGQIGRASLMNNTFNAYLYPNGAASPGAADAAPVLYADSIGADGGAILDGKCNTGNSLYCNVVITNLGQENYLLDLRALYKTAHVKISAQGYDGSNLRIKNAQTLVDSTGKAQDILRRVQVRLPSNNTYVRSHYVLETPNNICKQLQLTPDSSGSSSSCSP